MADKKASLLRLRSCRDWAELERLAEADLASVNAQIDSCCGDSAGSARHQAATAANDDHGRGDFLD